MHQRQKAAPKERRKVSLPPLPPFSAASYLAERNPLPDKVPPHRPAENPYLPKHGSPLSSGLHDTYTTAHCDTCVVCSKHNIAHLNSKIGNLRLLEREQRFALETVEQTEFDEFLRDIAETVSIIRQHAAVAAGEQEKHARSQRHLHDVMSFLFETEKFTRRSIWREAIQLLKAIHKCSRRKGEELTEALQQRKRREEERRTRDAEEYARQQRIQRENLIIKLQSQLDDLYKTEITQRCELLVAQEVEALTMYVNTQAHIELLRVERFEAKETAGFYARVAFENDAVQQRRPIEEQERSARHNIRIQFTQKDASLSLRQPSMAL